MDNPELRKKKDNFHNFIRNSGIKFGSLDDVQPDEKATCVVARVSQWKEENNEVWELEGNKSYAREGLVCDHCKEPVVMSNALYAQYIKSVNTPKLICADCMFGIVQKSNEKK